MKYTTDTLPVYHFYTAINGNISILGCDTPEEAEQLLYDTIEAFNEITGNKNNTDIIERIQLIRERTKYIICNNALEILRHTDNQEAVKLLNSNGFKFDLNNKSTSIENILPLLDALAGKINRLSAKIISDNIKNENEKINMYEIVVLIEKQLKFTIDVQTTPVIKFATYIKSLKDGK